MRPITAGTRYDRKAAEILSDSGLYDEQTANDIIQALFKKDILAFKGAPSWMEKYLKGIARMIVDYSGINSEGNEVSLEDAQRYAENFIKYSVPVFNTYLTYISALRDSLGGTEYDNKFIDDMQFRDVKLEIDRLKKKYKDIEDNEPIQDFGGSYTLIPIENYEQFHKMFGGNRTGEKYDDTEFSDNPWDGHSAWCHVNDKHTYDSYSCGNNFFVLARDGWENIPFNRASVRTNPKDEYGLSLIALIVSDDGELRYATLRGNHIGITHNPDLVGMNADHQFRSFKPLSKLAGFDVEKAVREYLGLD